MRFCSGDKALPRILDSFYGAHDRLVHRVYSGLVDGVKKAFPLSRNTIQGRRRNIHGSGDLATKLDDPGSANGSGEESEGQKLIPAIAGNGPALPDAISWRIDMLPATIGVILPMFDLAKCEHLPLLLKNARAWPPMFRRWRSRRHYKEICRRERKMSLPASGPREELHCRRIEMRGYRRPDGRFEIEGRLTDTKSAASRVDRGDSATQGSHLHDMSIRLVIDSDFLVHDVIAAMDAHPWGLCSEASATLGPLKGVRIGAGWKKAIAERLGGPLSCSHLRELLSSLGAAAYQSLSQERKSRPEKLDQTGRPLKIDSCYAYGSTRALVRGRWPSFYAGPAPTPPVDGD